MLKLSKEYELEIEIPIVYQELPADKLLIKPYDSILLVQLTDNGFNFYGRKILGVNNEIAVPLSIMRKSNYTTGDSQHYYILSKLLNEQLSSTFGLATNFRIVGPDTLNLYFSGLNAKEVKVYADVNVKLAPQFQLKNKIRIIPDHVTIYGDEKILEKTDSIFTNPLVLDNLSQDQFVEISLKLPEFLHSNPNKVQLEIGVEKYTEAEINIPIILDIQSDKKINIFPKSIKIRYAVSFEKYKEVKIEDFVVMASKDSLSADKLQIQLKKYPGFIRIIDFSPKMAEYIIIN